MVGCSEGLGRLLVPIVAHSACCIARRQRRRLARASSRHRPRADYLLHVDGGGSIAPPLPACARTASTIGARRAGQVFEERCALSGHGRDAADAQRIVRWPVMRHECGCVQRPFDAADASRGGHKHREVHPSAVAVGRHWRKRNHRHLCWVHPDAAADRACKGGDESTDGTAATGAFWRRRAWLELVERPRGERAPRAIGEVPSDDGNGAHRGSEEAGGAEQARRRGGAAISRGAEATCEGKARPYALVAVRRPRVGQEAGRLLTTAWRDR